MHVHSTASDGVLMPEQLMEEFQREDLFGASISDHNTVKGIIDLMDNPTGRGKFKGGLLPGIEVTCQCLGVPIEILGYGIDYRGLDRSGDVPTISPEIIAMLAQRKRAFKGCEDLLMPAERAIQIIRGHGGKAVLAHPLAYGENSYAIMELLKDKVDGIEAMHPTSAPTVGKKSRHRELFKFARDNRLIPTGGSDFHFGPKHTIHDGKRPCELILPFEKDFV